MPLLALGFYFHFSRQFLYSKVCSCHSFADLEDSVGSAFVFISSFLSAFWIVDWIQLRSCFSDCSTFELICGNVFSRCSVVKMVKNYPCVSAEYQKAVEKAKRKLRGLIAEKNCAPIMLRLAYDLSLSLVFLRWKPVKSCIYVCETIRLVQMALCWDLWRSDQDRRSLRNHEELFWAQSWCQQWPRHRSQAFGAHQGAIPQTLLRRFLSGMCRSYVRINCNGFFFCQLIWILFFFYNILSNLLIVIPCSISWPASLPLK